MTFKRNQLEPPLLPAPHKASNAARASAKDIAETMGRAEVDTQFIYIQTVDGAKHRAAKRLGLQLATHGHNSDVNEKNVMVN